MKAFIRILSFVATEISSEKSDPITIEINNPFHHLSISISIYRESITLLNRPVISTISPIPLTEWNLPCLS